eukprot:328412-Amphidinium_carterae.1
MTKLGLSSLMLPARPSTETHQQDGFAREDRGQQHTLCHSSARQDVLDGAFATTRVNTRRTSNDNDSTQVYAYCAKTKFLRDDTHSYTGATNTRRARQRSNPRFFAPRKHNFPLLLASRWNSFPEWVCEQTSDISVLPIWSRKIPYHPRGGVPANKKNNYRELHNNNIRAMHKRGQGTKRHLRCSYREALGTAA